MRPLPAAKLNWLAIVNPIAGFARTGRQKQAIAEYIQREIGAKVVFTEGPGHAGELAAATGADALAVFGGDGTLGEVVNGMALGSQRLLILPGGTGNGLARDLGLTSLKSAFARVGAGRLRALDLIQVIFQTYGQTQTRLEISTASLGYTAEVVGIANDHFKSLGEWCYPLASTLQAARQHWFTAWLQMDEHDPVERILTNVMVNNTRHAGNFRAFRQADPGDGRFEVLLSRAGFARQVLHNLAVLTGTYFYATAAEVSARSLRVKLALPRALMIDGELWPDVMEAHFQIAPDKLQCVV